MVGLAVRRLAAVVPVLLFLTAVMFVLDALSPIDPARAVLGPGAPASAVARLRVELGLDDPVPLRYLHYLQRLVLHADLGYSTRLREPVADGLARALPHTVELALVALVLTVLLAVLLGLGSAGRWRGAGVVRGLLVAGASAPSFLLCIGGILVFYSWLGWLPSSGTTSYEDVPEGPTGMLLVDSLAAGQLAVFLDALLHVLMPAVCVALVPAVAVGRTLRGSLLDTLPRDHVRTARTLGQTERRILLRHVLRNALGPALSMLGVQTGLLFAGVVVVETIFAWPGIGLYAAQAVPAGDFAVISGVALVIGVVYVLGNAVVDLLQELADPRMRS